MAGDCRVTPGGGRPQGRALHDPEVDLRQEVVVAAGAGLVRRCRRSRCCWRRRPAWGGGALSVVTTSTDLKSLVDAVGGDRVARREPGAAAPRSRTRSEVKPSQLAAAQGGGAARAGSVSTTSRGSRALVPRVSDPRFAPGGASDLDASGDRPPPGGDARVRSERGVHVHGFGNHALLARPGERRARSPRRSSDALTRLAAGRARGLRSETERASSARLDAGLARWTAARWRPIAARASWRVTRAGPTSRAALRPRRRRARSSRHPACRRRPRRLAELDQRE